MPRLCEKNKTLLPIKSVQSVLLVLHNKEYTYLFTYKIPRKSCLTWSLVSIFCLAQTYDKIAQNKPSVKKSCQITYVWESDGNVFLSSQNAKTKLRPLAV